MYCTDIKNDIENNVKEYPFFLSLTSYKGQFFLPFKHMEEKFDDFVKLDDVVVDYATKIAKDFFKLDYDFYLGKQYNMKTYFIEEKNLIDHLISLEIKRSLLHNIIINNVKDVKNHFISKVPIANSTVMVNSNEHIGGTKFEKRFSTDAFDFDNYRKEQFKDVFKNLL